MILALFGAGLILLVIGAEALVRGASKLAVAAGISPLIIGLTIVAYGTSAPEMVVSVISGLAGNADIAVGNVVGSNIFNVLFILGLSSLITPLVVSAQLVRLDVPIMIAVSILALVLGADGYFDIYNGVLLFSCIIGYTVFLIYQSRRDGNTSKNMEVQNVSSEKNITPGKFAANIGLILMGLFMLILGSNWFVQGAVTIAQYFGISQLVIGITVVAIGTSLPELATSVVAAIHGERDIAVGNVVGSNIFNILGVLGLSAILTPGGIVVSVIALRLDIPIMIAVAVVCLPVFFTGNVISRLEGGLFLGYYLAYTLYLVLSTTQNAMFPTFTTVMLWVVIPLTALTLMVHFLRAIHINRQ